MSADKDALMARLIREERERAEERRSDKDEINGDDEENERLLRRYKEFTGNGTSSWITRL